MDKYQEAVEAVARCTQEERDAQARANVAREDHDACAQRTKMAWAALRRMQDEQVRHALEQMR